MLRHIYITATFGLLALLGASCSKTQSSATDGSFTMMCDDSFENIMKLEIDVFEFDYPKVTALDRYAPYSEVLDSLMSLNTKTVVMPRDLTPQERETLRSKGRNNVRSQRIAVDAVALIVNPDNPVDNLSMEEIRDILDGHVSTWYQLYPTLPDDTIRVLFDSSGSSMAKYMRDSLLSGAPLGPNAYAVGSVQAVLDGVRDRRNAIGVIGVSWLTSDLRERDSQPSDSLSVQVHREIDENTATDAALIDERVGDSGVKVLGVRRAADKPYYDARFMNEYDEFKAYKPFQNDIYKGFYPLTRSIYLITTAYSDSPAGGFYSFVTGKIGQKILQRTGVMPAVFRNEVVEVGN